MAELKNRGLVRLNRFIAQSGVCSRRAADRLIQEGEVQINGRRVYELGVQVNPLEDKVKVEGKLIYQSEKKIYAVFFKPKGVVTTLSDPEGRPAINDYLHKITERVFPVGRLDFGTEGLLILTNDGDFANRVMHPKFDVTKTYLVKLDGHPTDEQLEKLKKGVSIIGGKVKAKFVSYAKVGDSDKYEWIRIGITEGKNHQIKKMFQKIGYDVIKLRRVAIGELKLGQMRPGEIKEVAYHQIERVFQDPEISPRVHQSIQRTRKITLNRQTSRPPKGGRSR